MQKSLQERRLKFARRKMKIDVDPIEMNMVEIVEFVDAYMLEGTSESPDVDLVDIYPKPKEDLLDFLYCCKNKGLQACLCPRCGALIEKLVVENFQKL